MEVDYEGLQTAAWEYGSDPLTIQCATGGSVAEAVDTLERALALADSGLDSPSRVAVQDLAVMDVGVAVEVCNHGGVEGLTSWLRQLSRAIESLGGQGRLGLATRKRAPIDFPAPALDCTVAGLVFSRQSVEGDKTEWLVSAATTSELVRRAHEWCAGLDGAMYFSHHGVSTRVAPQQGLELLGHAMRMKPPATLCSVSGDLQFRRVLFSELGHVLFELREETSGVERARQMTQVMRANASLIDYGFVRAGRGPSTSWWDALTRAEPRPPAAAGTYYVVLRADEVSYVPDAYGMQVLAEQHLRRAHSLESWDVTELDAGRYLVSGDPAQWFAPGQPSEAVIAQARRDFGQMVISHDVLGAASARLRRKLEHPDQ